MRVRTRYFLTRLAVILIAFGALFLVLPPSYATDREPPGGTPDVTVRSDVDVRATAIAGSKSDALALATGGKADAHAEGGHAEGGVGIGGEATATGGAAATGPISIREDHPDNIRIRNTPSGALSTPADAVGLILSLPGFQIGGNLPWTPADKKKLGVYDRLMRDDNAAAAYRVLCRTSVMRPDFDSVDDCATTLGGGSAGKP